MKIRNNNIKFGKFSLENLFPYAKSDNATIHEEDARIKAEAMAAAAASENIENTEDSSSSNTDNTSERGKTKTGGTTINGNVYINNTYTYNNPSPSPQQQPNYSAYTDDEVVVDVDFADVTDTPNPQQYITQAFSKEELTMRVRQGDYDGLKALDKIISSSNISKLLDLFRNNKYLCLWIKRPTQLSRYNKLPVVVQELINNTI